MATPIRWRKKDLEKLSTYIRKFNASITKTAKKQPELLDSGILPEKLNVKEVKEKIYSRADYNRVIKRIDRWFEPGARDLTVNTIGQKITKWLSNEIKYAKQRVSYQQKKRLQEAGFSGHQQAELKQLMKDPYEREERIIRRQEKIDWKEMTTEEAETAFRNESQLWQNFVKQLFNQDSDEYLVTMNQRYYDNTLLAIERNFTKEQYDELKKTLVNLGIDGYQLFLMGGVNPNINFEYYYSEEETDEKFKLLVESIQKEHKKLKGENKEAFSSFKKRQSK